MTPYSNRLTPLTQRMAEDMLVRNLSSSSVSWVATQLGPSLVLGRDPAY